ncbi:major facilitator superfamily domain-containing protein [Dipodascopsis uninucleata]
MVGSIMIDPSHNIDNVSAPTEIEIIPKSVFSDKKRTKTKVQKFLGFIWDAFEKEGQERSFVLRLDAFMFTYSLISYIIKILDQSNINNAFVSGMQEDLKLYGQERNLFTTVFNMGYLTGSLPGQIILTSGIRASYYIPCCEIVWSVLVMAIAACNSAKPIYVLRFFEGLAESAIFPGFNLILGSWYVPDELGKRMALFEMSAQAANMFSGYIQAGVYASMNGRYGIAGWRWLFIIDGIISIPVAIAGFFQVPDFPTNTRAWYLKQDDREYARERMKRIGRKEHKKLTVKEFFRIFSSWKPYLFLWPYLMVGFGAYTSYFNLWLKATGKFSVELVNIIPTGGNAIGLVCAYVMANLSDRTGTRWVWMAISNIPPLIGAIMLSVWYIPEKAIMAANFLGYAGSAHQPLSIAWSAEAFQDNASMRGLILGFGNTISYAMSAWMPLVMFPTPDAPHYKVGYQLCAVFIGLDFIGLYLFWYMIRRDTAKHKKVLNEYGLPAYPDVYAVAGSEENHIYLYDEQNSQNEKSMPRVQDKEIGSE